MRNLQRTIFILVSNAHCQCINSSVINILTKSKGSIAVIGRAIRNNLLNGVSINLTYITGLISEILKYEAAVCLNHCGLQQRCFRIIQTNREYIVLQRLAAFVDFSTRQRQLPGFGTIHIRKLNSCIRHVRITGIHYSLRIGHLSGSIVRNNNSDMELSRRVMNTLRMLCRDVFFNQEVMSAFAKRAKVYFKITVNIMCDIIIFRCQTGNVKGSVRAVQSECKLACSQQTVFQILFTVKHYANGFTVVLVYECNALNSITCNFVRDRSIAVVIDLYGNRKGLTGPGNAICTVRAVRCTVGSYFFDGVGVSLTDVISIVLNRTEGKGSVGKIGGSANLFTSLIVQTESVVSGMKRLVTVVNLYSLDTVNNNLDRLYGVGIMESNLLCYRVLKVVLCLQCATIIGYLND